MAPGSAGRSDATPAGDLRVTPWRCALQAEHALSATILGTAVKGHRAHDDVLYGPSARASAVRVAGALRAPTPTALSGGALSMFGSVARVVVLVGRSD